MLCTSALLITLLSASPIDLVNPLVGTDDMGHTYPGATVPFGQYADSTIVGFAHTHFTGTGHSDLGDLLMMPTTGPLDLGDYASGFSHEWESAHPGDYRVHLDDHRIEAELTTTERVGVHRYTFPETDQAHLILEDNPPGSA